jgi:hypothetical protein
MSHFLLVPVNENGVIVDPNITTILQDAMTAPFAFSDVFIYSHGWRCGRAVAWLDSASTPDHQRREASP